MTSFYYLYVSNLLMLLIQATIDLNLPELEYLADHLEPEECRKLVAALHFNSYQMPNALDSAERKLSEEIPCIRLLLHWSSAKNEGYGQTHSLLEHRLRQLGRLDLADWIGKTVFQQLGKDLQHSLDDPFADVINANRPTEESKTVLESEDEEEPNSWIPFDSICFAIIIALGLTSMVVLFRVIWNLSPCCKANKSKRSNRRKRILVAKNYHELENEAGASGTDSETEIFTANGLTYKDDAALKAMGIKL